jgi:hypothetical protein
MENQAEYGNRKGSKLASANLSYFMEDPEEIGRLGLKGEKYDGSPVHYVKIGKNLGELVVHLINQDRISDFLSHPKKAPTSAWDIQKRENQEKVVRYFGLDFLL